MNVTSSNRAARFAGWADLWFFEHEGRLHAITQEALDAAFDNAVSDAHASSAGNAAIGNHIRYPLIPNRRPR